MPWSSWGSPSRLHLVSTTYAFWKLESYPTGILSFQMSLVSWGANLEISVMMYPGDTALARANRAHSTAKLLTR